MILVKIVFISVKLCFLVQQQNSKMLNFMQLSSGVTSAVSGPPPPHAHHLFGPDQILFGPPRKHDPGVLYHPMQSTVTSHQVSGVGGGGVGGGGGKFLSPLLTSLA